LSSSRAELMIQKVTVNNMDVMFALCTSLKSNPGIPYQLTIISTIDWTGRTKGC
jgi:hypothetical protein